MPAVSSDFAAELAALAEHLSARRQAILQAWRSAVRSDPSLSSGRILTRAEINDHLPALIASFERDLRAPGAAAPASPAAPGGAVADAPSGAPEAAAHGLHRWQQGYELLEVAVELGRLNECVSQELEDYAASHPALAPGVMAEARRRWARACTVAIGESTHQFYRLQQMEAASHIDELENALDDLLELERAQAALWEQAAHDLRGNVAVVANATAGLATGQVQADTFQRLRRLLEHNIGALNHLLNDVTTLARLQAGEERRNVAPFDAAALLSDLCQGLQSLAEERNLSLRFSGPPVFDVEGDAVKTRRIAQNLVLNALAYTRQGGVELGWGEAPGGDGRRWVLTLKDTGPGLRLDGGSGMPAAVGEATAQAGPPGGSDGTPAWRPAHSVGGEGLGLSIVKRLCDLLDATVEVMSTQDVGTTFRILLPRRYRD